MDNQACPNCGHEYSVSDQFCPNCGQKNADRLITLRELLSEFFDSIFNLNSALLQTVREIFIPGQLTIRFFQGKRKSYYPPLRLFFVSMLAFYALMGFKYIGQIDEWAGTPFPETVEQERMLNLILDSTMYRLDTAMTMSPSQELVRDTLKQFILSEFQKQRASMSHSGLSLNAGNFDSIPMHDFILLSPDSLIRKYHISGLWNQLTLKQTQRIFKQPVAMIRYLIGNTTWMNIALVPFLALGLSLLYFRSRRYYIEHLVFLFHYHSFIFIFLLLYFLLIGLLPKNFALLPVLFILAYLWVAMRRYYGNNSFKTTLKFIILLIFYCIAFFLFMIITSFISFLIFQ